MSGPDSEWITCNNNTCQVRFTKEYFSSGLQEAPVADGHKYHQVLEGIISTRLFCMTCSRGHATVICRLSRIESDSA